MMYAYVCITHMQAQIAQVHNELPISLQVCAVCKTRSKETKMEESQTGKKDADVFLDRARANIFLGNDAAAMKDLNEAISKDSSNPIAYYNRGYLRELQEKCAGTTKNAKITETKSRRKAAIRAARMALWLIFTPHFP